MADLRWFDPRTTEPAQTFEPLPAGDYPCVIIESEMADTKSGTGKRLKFTFEVVGGQYKGRRLWEGLNISNPSQKAQEIARGQLSSICRAVGVLSPVDSSELHNKPLIVTVGLEQGLDGAVQNRVRGFRGVGGPTHEAPRPAPPQPLRPAVKPAPPPPSSIDDSIPF